MNKPHSVECPYCDTRHTDVDELFGDHIGDGDATEVTCDNCSLTFGVEAKVEFTYSAYCYDLEDGGSPCFFYTGPFVITSSGALARVCVRCGSQSSRRDDLGVSPYLVQRLMFLLLDYDGQRINLNTRSLHPIIGADTPTGRAELDSLLGTLAAQQLILFAAIPFDSGATAIELTEKGADFAQEIYGRGGFTNE